MKKLVVIVALAISFAVGFGSNAGQAHAAGGFLSTIQICPGTAPYLHINVFGSTYCSIHP
jgi:hypothetical protein